ncbi:MAG: SIMPL domain-containing protein [Planctomycetota bacterium]
MRNFVSMLVIAIYIAMLFQSGIANAQGGGGFGGAGMFGGDESMGSYSGGGRLGGFRSELSEKKVLNYISIEGSAETRLTPTEIRVVMAVSEQDESAQACKAKVEEVVKRVEQAWKNIRIQSSDINADFIAMLPRYEWRLTERDGERIRMQKRVGYRMQTNLHVSVPNEARAMEAIKKAFDAGVTDIVTFDYWSPKLDEQKQKTMALAVKAARKKADVLLEVFPKRPTVINVRESTNVHFPHSLYHTFENILEEQAEWNSSWRNTPMIKAFRPKMTFLNSISGDYVKTMRKL